MSAIAFKFTCANCGTEFLAPEVSETSYGEFVMRTHGSNETAYLDATQDRAFMESYELVKQHPQVANQKRMIQAEIQQSVFTVTCDRAPNGEKFAIGLRPMCPSCSTRNMKSWEPVIPIRNWPIPIVTHQLWEAKSVEEKNVTIKGAVAAVLTLRGSTKTGS